MTDDEQCGVEKANGDRCEYPAKYADGKCGIHSDINGDTQGRPTKFNDERARLAIEAAREGKSEAGCERAAGIGQGTLAGEGAWLNQNHTFENGDGLIDSFSQAFAQARAEGESMYIKDGRSKEGDTSFAKHQLASSFGYVPESKQVNEHSGEVSGDFSVNINHHRVTDENEG